MVKLVQSIYDPFSPFYTSTFDYNLFGISKLIKCVQDFNEIQLCTKKLNPRYTYPSKPARTEKLVLHIQMPMYNYWISLWKLFVFLEMAG